MNVKACFSSLSIFSFRIFGALLMLLLALSLLAGCATRQSAPVERRQPDLGDDYVIVNGVRQPRSAVPGSQTITPQMTAGKETHVVQPGDTLYSIAMQNELNPQDVAMWNRISDPSKIAVGQEIRLTPPAGTQVAAGAVTTAPLQTVPPVGTPPVGASLAATMPGGPGAPVATFAGSAVKTTPKAVKEPYSEQKLAAMTADTSTAVISPPTQITPQVAATSTATTPPPETATATVGGLSWTWPTQGKVISNFSNSASLKGIDIAGAIGQPVVASAAGRVVYVGSGLRGYGNLIIVKHNDAYLSVYAHNKEILVKQGQQIARGQKIAEMGNSDADQVKLHFEVRENGKPVDPMKFLPTK